MSAEAFTTLIAAFEERLERERSARLKAEAALLSAASARTAAEGYPLFSIGKIISPFTADHGVGVGMAGTAPTLRGAPRQGALAPDTRAVLQLNSFLPPAALEGLAEYSHVFVFWLFNDDDSKPRTTSSPPPALASCPWVLAGRPFAAKISPPGLFGVRTGVFATRSPHRPNAVGVSLCTLRSVDPEARSLVLSGVDLFDGTPVVDIKPACEYDCGQCAGRLEAAVPRGATDLPQHASPVRFPSWVEAPLNARPPVRVVWSPCALDAARASVKRGCSRFYGSTADECDSFVRSVTQIVQLDPRSFAHGRGAPKTRHVTTLEAARAAAAAAVGGAHPSVDSTVLVPAEEGAPPAEPLRSYVLRYDSVLLQLSFRDESDPEVLEAQASGDATLLAAPLVSRAAAAAAAQVCLIERCEDVLGDTV